jgi:hypothetical protein
MKITEYRNTDGHRRWEFSYEGITFVLLNEGAPSPYNSELLAFKGLELVWRISPQTKTDYDYIVNVWVKGNEFYAGSFSGYEHKFNYQTGEIIETKFTK